MTRAELRKLLAAVLPIPAELEKFCVDHFPEVAAQCGRGMLRSEREDQLLERHGSTEILAKLRQEHAAAVDKHVAQVAGAAKATISGDLLKRILELAKTSTWPKKALVHAYYMSAPREWQYYFDSTPSEDLLGSMLIRLASALCQSDGAHPILRFVLHLMRVATTTGAPDLLDWFGQAADYLGVSAPRRVALQREIEGAAHSDERELHLVLVITRHADPAYDYAVRASRVLVPLGKERWSADDVEVVDGYEHCCCRSVDMPDLMTEILNCIQPDLAQADGRLTIEIVAPVDLLGCDVDRWRVDPEDSTLPPHGADHYVVVRSWERAYGVEHAHRARARLDAARRNWHAKWKQLHSSCDCLVWACSREDAAAGISQKLHGGGPPCVAVRFPPAGGAAELRQIIDAGVPIATWPRETPKDEARFQACIAQLAIEKPPTWHAVVKAYRAEAYRTQDHAHPGHLLAVLRDDPNKLLPDARPSARLARPAPTRY